MPEVTGMFSTKAILKWLLSLPLSNNRGMKVNGSRLPVQLNFNNYVTPLASGLSLT